MSQHTGAASCPSTPLSQRRMMGDWSSLTSPGFPRRYHDDGSDDEDDDSDDEGDDDDGL